MKRVLSIPLCFAHLASAAFLQAKWPYTLNLDYQERLLWETGGLRGFAGDCDLRDSTTVAAQWVRLAYHDMSTHNVADGTGGLDGSIRFETDRPENVGVGMLSSLRDFGFHLTPFTSMADMMAMGVVMGYQTCGGPTVPYRYGRIDATQAGVSGVPEPHQDLQSHTDSFARQGFTPSEMIALVACGHTLGGVSSDDFPTANLNEEFSLFTGEQTYNRGVVTNYLDGTTVNPLVTSSNETMRSDLRIFSSDQNTTMQRLSEKETFDSTCVDLLGRMINTVPSGVRLSDVLDPIENKIGKTRLFVSSVNASLQLSTTLRLFGSAENRQVSILWADRNPSFCPSSGCKKVSTDVEPLENLSPQGGIARGFGFIDVQATLYHFSFLIDPNASISKFWFEVEQDGKTTVVDNGGEGYAIDQDILLFDPVRSVGKFLPGTGFTLITTAGVKDGHSLSKLEATSLRNDAGSGPQHIPIIETWELTLDDSHPPVVGYSFYSVKLDTTPGMWDLKGTFAEGDITQEFIEETEVRSMPIS
ncbi:heme peroxidase [Flagelloscypha sp. PMI_526]|nr:heme peroxidase [Flagelloscypha sp. PMI_526]